MVIRSYEISEQHERISLGENTSFNIIKILNIGFENPYSGKHAMQVALGGGLDQCKYRLSDGSFITYFYAFPLIDNSTVHSQHHDSQINQVVEQMGKTINHFDVNLYMDGVPLATGALTDSNKLYMELYFE